MRKYKIWILSITLCFLLVGQSLAQVYLKHLNREQVYTLNQLQQTRDALDVEWTQLLLEESTLSTHSRIDAISKKELYMHGPNRLQIRWIQP